MITRVVQGDLLKSRAQTLVNTVNTVGIMGKGIALEFKKRFPEMYRDYEERCRLHRVRLGEPYVFKREQPPWIINFPTKGHWRSVSRLSDIDAGLRYLRDHVIEWGVQSLAVPPLGCGQGQLEWRVVGPTIRRHLEGLPISVELYAPLDVPPYQATLEFITEAVTARNEPAGRLRPEWVAIAAVVDRISQNPYTWPIGHTRLQKIAYFLTSQGVPTKLGFVKGSYGPFSPDLRQVLSRLVNNGVLAEVHEGRRLRVLPGTTWSDAKAAYEADMAPYEGSVDRVSDLMARLDDERSEAAGAVHFAAATLREQASRVPSEAEVLRAVMEWKVRRRPPVEAPDVAEAIRSLSAQGWVEVEPSSDLPIDESVFVVA